VHPNLVALWKKQLQENAPELFERSRKDKGKEAAEHKEEELYREIGQLQVENEFLKKVQTGVQDRTAMVEPKHPELSIRRQCALLGIPKASYYYKPKVKKTKQENNVCILAHIREVLEKTPFYGYRKVARSLSHVQVTRKQVRRIMQKAGLRAIYPARNLSKPRKGAAKYPYVLKDKAIWPPNQVWASDITYIRLSHGTVYLVTIIDVYSRKILSWKLSNTMDMQFCLSALEHALNVYGIPAIFDTDQGSQFTSPAFTGRLIEEGIRISNDGRKRALDNIVVERFWRSLKYEEVYLMDYANVNECRIRIDDYIRKYNSFRPHQTLLGQTPDSVYESGLHSIVDADQAYFVKKVF